MLMLPIHAKRKIRRRKSKNVQNAFNNDKSTVICDFFRLFLFLHFMPCKASTFLLCFCVYLLSRIATTLKITVEWVKSGKKIVKDNSNIEAKKKGWGAKNESNEIICTLTPAYPHTLARQPKRKCQATKCKRKKTRQK